MPHWRRNDVTREADLIEEVARLHGMDDQLPATLPDRRGAIGVLTPQQRMRRRAEDALTAGGLLEIVGWSFDTPSRDDRLRLPADDERRRHVVIENPMSADQSVLRTTLLGSLLDAASHNAARGQGVPAIFECGAVYRATGETAPARAPRDRRARAGRRVRREGARRGAAAHAARATRRSRARRSRSCIPAAAPRCASARTSSAGSATCTRSSPATGTSTRIAAFELDLDRVIGAAPLAPRYEDLTSFPELREDIAIVVDAGVPAATVLETVRSAGGKLLARAEVFDVYRGEQIAAGRTSLAIALTFRAKDRTLTDADVAPIREKIVAKLAQELGGELRG